MTRLISAALLAVAALALIVNASGAPDQQAQTAAAPSSNAIVLVAD